MQELSCSIVEPRIPGWAFIRSKKIMGLIPSAAKLLHAKVYVSFSSPEKIWRRICLIEMHSRCLEKTGAISEVFVRDIREIKITVRDAEVLKLLVQGCSNKEIASQLKISPRTVKQHLRTMFLRAGIRDGRKRVKLATAMFQKEQMDLCNRVNS
ncbi:MAG TPA: helix-turn-helix transcriptional regulator [Terriglobales bacterium]|nr:helix-turn-helix transcriptional regulator [Terriglobales bacterium]